MGKKSKKAMPSAPEDLRLEPEKRVVSRFDSESIAEFPVAAPGRMGMRVRDNCSEENIQ